MNKSMPLWLAGVYLIFTIQAFADTKEMVANKDVTYFAIVKNLVFAQDWEKNVSVTTHSFLAYIFLKDDYLHSDTDIGYNETLLKIADAFHINFYICDSSSSGDQKWIRSSTNSPLTIILYCGSNLNQNQDTIEYKIVKKK